MLNTIIITIIITITITIAIATRIGVIVNTAIIIIIIIVGRDRTGREGGVWVYVTSSVTGVGGGTPPPETLSVRLCVSGGGGGGGPKSPIAGLRALSTLEPNVVVKSSESCCVSPVLIGKPEVEKLVTLCLGELATDCMKKSRLSGCTPS